MKCVACGAQNRGHDDLCFQCGAPLDRPPRPKRSPAMTVARGVMMIIFGLITLVALGLLTYRLYFWYEAVQLERLYTKPGQIAPEIEAVELEDGRLAHAITFFGEDGDAVFIKELRESYQIVGHMARITIPDSHWFPVAPEDAEAALVTLTPILNTYSGDQKPLPTIDLTIETPQSPLKLVTPSSAWEKVVTSIYPLKIQVIPKSTVVVGGKDVSDVVDYEGYLSVNVAVHPVGDNIISILVSTPNHRQTRQDINLYRDYQEINLEPDLNLDKKWNRPTMTISGTVDPEATLTVDSPHLPESIEVKPTGSFKFTAKLETVGDNIITFRASKPGKQDSVVSVTVYYVPTLNAYSRSAWKMDYQQLSLYYEIWQGRVFLCDGVVVDVTVDGDEQSVVMDVGTPTLPQYVILTNYSSVGTPEIGARYKAYADVTGNEFYENVYCPKLACRYMIAQ